MTSRKRAVKLGLLGWPLEHTLSPEIFSRLSEEAGIAVDYRPVPVRPEDLAVSLARLRAEGWRGVNVTIPHKQAVIPLLTGLEADARKAGAVNVIRFTPAALKGHNTDVSGFARALTDAGFLPTGRDAVVFGAGGAARAVGLALSALRARRVRFVARSEERARALVKDLASQVKMTRYSAGEPVPAPLWVNATPLGMRGFPDASPCRGAMPGCELAFDLVYGRRTPFLRQAEAAGARSEDGLGMLVAQAMGSWAFLLGSWPPSRSSAVKKSIVEELRCRCAT